MMSPYRLAGEMPPAPKPAKVTPVELEDDIDSAVACRQLQEIECEIPRDDGFLQYLCIALMVSFSIIGMVAALTSMAR